MATKEVGRICRRRGIYTLGKSEPVMTFGASGVHVWTAGCMQVWSRGQSIPRVACNDMLVEMMSGVGRCSRQGK